MSWNPDVNVIDATSIVENLIAYLEANQVEALKWANGGDALPPILEFFNSERIVTRFPSLRFIKVGHATVFNDLSKHLFSVIVEVVLQGGNVQTLATESRKYSMAVESMFAQVPETTFSENSIIDYRATIDTLETDFDVMRSNKNKFIQIFQVNAVWELFSKTYNR